jgi:MYXO-CTERM domain-containing protein
MVSIIPFLGLFSTAMAAPSIDAGGPYTVAAESSVTLTATDADAGDCWSVGYRWDTNGDGSYDTSWSSTESTTFSAAGYDGPTSLTATAQMYCSVWFVFYSYYTDTASITITNVAPVISSVTKTTSGAEGDSLSYSVAYSDVETADTHTITWDWGDGETSSGASTTHTWADDGAYTVTVTVTDDDGGSDSESFTVTLTNANPKISSSSFTTTGNEGSSLSYSAVGTDAGTADALTYTWSFGDGDTATGSSVTHEFADNGSYTVTLTVTDDDGGSKSTSKTVTISNVAPTLTLTGDTSGEAGDALTWVATVTDPGADDTHTYAWTFGDGSSATTSGSASHSYASTGSYTVSLTVTDDDGGSSTETLSVDITASPPVISSFTGDTSGAEGDTLSWACSGTAGDGGAVTVAWTLGDGTTATGGTASRAYADDGTYAVTCMVTDSAGTTASQTKTVTVSNATPVISRSTIPATGTEGSSGSFSALATDAGTADTLTYNWDFGDGDTGTGASTTHTYVDDGTYTVTLTVTDDDGASVTTSGAVVVANAAPSITLTGDSSGDEGDTLDFSVSISDAGTADTHTVAWTSSDGGTGTGTSYSNNFKADGTYTVTATVTDDDGGTDTASTSVVISNVGPTVTSMSGTTTGDEGTELELTCQATDPGSADTLSWVWDFGDGDTDTDGTVSHAWSDEGDYTATCTVTDGTESDSASNTITILNVAPSLEGTPDSVGEEDVEWTFAPTATDPGDDTLSFTLEGPTAAVVDASAGVVTWTPSWEEVGSQEFTLTVDDGDGGSASLSWTVDVSFTDLDDDSMADTWEDAYGLDPGDAADALLDGDGDGRTNLEEFEAGTDPTNYDGPGVPTLLSPADLAEVDVFEPTLEVGPAAAPLGQELTYSMAVYADAKLATLVTQVDGIEDAGDISSWTVDVSLDENTWYWWTAWADDGWTLGDAAEPSTFFVNTVNDPPTAPTLQSPFDGGGVSTLAPTFTFDEALDLDEDALTYSIRLLDIDGNEVDAITDIVGDGLSASWELDWELSDDTDYCWTASATDEHGLSGPEADVACFFVDLENLAPSAPVILAPANGEVVASSSTVVVLQDGVDPEGRTIEHVVELGQDAGFKTLVDSDQLATDGTGTTSWDVADLEEDVWYWVRARCTDGAGSSDWATASFFVSTQNDPPTAPTLFNPGDGASWGETDPLVVLDATDPEGQALTYDFELRTRDGELVATTSGIEPDGSGQTDWLPESLGAGLYLWTARATDSDGLSGEWASARFLLVGSDDGADGGGVDSGTDQAGAVGCACAASPNQPLRLAWLLGMLGLTAFVRRRR